MPIYSEYDFVLVVDASGSMATTDCPGGKSRWKFAEETIVGLAHGVAAFDSDGIDVIIFSGSSVKTVNGVSASAVSDIFASRMPNGGTPLAEALTEAFKVAGKSDKKDFIIVLTDGVPDDKSAAARVIVEQSKKQETDDALTILFIQVGKDAAAGAYLKSLDDDLKGAKFDIVDVKTFEELEQFGSIEKLLEAAIND